MNQILKPKQKVKTVSSKMAVEVDTFLGGGGQGEVYKATMGGKAIALKWYYPSSGTPEQRAAIEALVKSGAPSDEFLWPMDLCEEKGLPAYGYIMPLREKRFRGIVDIFFRRSEPSMRVLATVAMNMADTFMQLHAKGLCSCSSTPRVCATAISRTATCSSTRTTATR
jgi:eukaryotic-like serine/threonine-protein kinase